MPPAIVAVLLVAASAPEPANPLRLPVRTSPYCRVLTPLAGGGVACVDSGSRPVVLDPEELDAEPLDIDWDPAEAGWEWTGKALLLRASPDGTRILLGLCVGIPDSVRPEGVPVMDPMLLVVCSDDGTDARPLALTMQVGGGPRFDFTSDSRSVYGTPILDCPPDPEAYMEQLAQGLPTTADTHLIDICTGSQRGDCAGLLADGFLPDPFSDLVAAGARPPDLLLDVTTGEVLLEDSTGGGIIHRWVLPGAGLAREGGNQIVRFAEGRETRNPGGEVRVHLRLEDGRYLYSRGGGEDVLLGGIDWSDFSPRGTSGLTGITEAMVDGIVAQAPEMDGILFIHDGSVWIYRHELL